MKTKLKTIIGTTLIAATLIPSVVFADDQKPITVFVDGQQLNFEVSPVIQDGTTLVPMRAVFEKLGLKVEWNASAKTITGTKDGLSIQMQIGNKEVSVNGKIISLEVAPNIIEGSTLVPLRFVGEASGNEIAWDGTNRRIDVKSKGNVNAIVTTLTRKDGVIYTGEIKDGLPNGKGTLVFPDVTKYEGTFLNGLQDGYGTLTGVQGWKYIGDFKSNQSDGNGKFIFADGQYYIGNFKNNKMDGQGTEYDANGNVVRSGLYSSGQYLGVTSLPAASQNGSNLSTSSSIVPTSPSTSNKLDQVNQEYNRHNQALQTLQNNYDRTINFIDDKITSIQRSSPVGYYSDSEYNQKLTSLQSQRQAKQNSLDALSMDNSPEGATQRRQLTKDVADFDQQIKNLQDGRSSQLQIQALEDQRKQEDRDYQSRVQAENTLYQNNLGNIR
ncbi:stalk domain-containing protein [Paenibacillus sp. GCM10027628]|uniref:stalk domain-containing protein n=1 Tax=Paenibacillus sp. GCM10027628 TaxID=3273413 RepID=UPI003642E468